MVRLKTFEKAVKSFYILDGCIELVLSAIQITRFFKS